MNPLYSIDDLKNKRLHNEHQKFYYVILTNPNDITPAGQILLDNLDLFDLDTGERCDYFLPGFINDDDGLSRYAHLQFGEFKHSAFISRLGKLSFNPRAFFEFYNYLEMRNTFGWSYSGACELILLDINYDKRVNLDKIISYNLDDIIRNKRSLSEFIRGMIRISIEETDKQIIKNRIDELFCDMIMPNTNYLPDNEYFKFCSKIFEDNFAKKDYCFISYSTKDFRFVKRIRSILTENGITCWMAPFDIPNGTNYAYIIELALKNASNFVLMLSKNSVNSVWVIKELLRAINQFQSNNTTKLCVAWLDDQFALDGTPFALPLEDIQITCKLKNDIKNVSSLIEILKKGEKYMPTSDNLKLAQNEIPILYRMYQALAGLDGSIEALQNYVNCLNDFTAIDCIYSPEISIIYNRLITIIQACQEEDRSFSKSESGTLQKDANRLLKICIELKNANKIS